MDSTDLKRVTIFAGHYGSGKTNVAVNYAINAVKNHDTIIADLDIVNPYFRTKDSEAVLNSHGITLISSAYANSNVDTPALPAEAYSVIHDRSKCAVIDVGGDDRGALALGRFAPDILNENNYEMLFVINKYRAMTRDAKSTVEIMREIENAASIRFTGIVNNSNLGEETTEETVLSSLSYADEVSCLSGLGVKMVTAKRNIAEKLSKQINNLFPIEIYIQQSWLR